MRIDLALKYLCLVKSRSIAKSLCERGQVLVNGSGVRPSSNVKPGDRITVDYASKSLTIELVEAPEKQLGKSKALAYYRLVGEERSERDPLDDL
jgi:ribosomal 50S subunit-recycling heat shock protein